MGTSARHQRELIDSLDDGFARRALGIAYHLRKYSLLYVCGAIGALALAIFPVVGSGGGTVAANGAGALGANGAAGAAGAAGSGSPVGMASTAGGGTAGGGSAGAGPSGSAAPSGGSSAAAGAAGASGGTGPVTEAVSGGGAVVQNAAGSGCQAGQHQIPWSPYSDMCIPGFSGSNGGATTRGVSAKTITIAVRETSDAQGANALASQAEGEAAGGVSDATNWGYVQSIVKWMNSQYELYGRQVNLQLFQGQGNETNEELDQGQAQACADADTEANSIHAFGGINYLGIFETGVFSDCATRYQVYIPQGAAYFPESWYVQHSPYVWATTMNCSLIAEEVAEWMGKQIMPYPTKWAGSDGVTGLNGKQRKLGTYVPNNAEYQECVGIYSHLLEGTYHVPKAQMDQYNYALDIATFPQDAQKAIIQFAANQDTTVVLACDPISPIFLTQDAVQQNYYPEWALIGVAGTDTDNYAQLWDQKAITGHLWGLSQLAPTQQLLSAQSDAGTSLTKMGLPVNISSVGDYYALESMFNQLQIAGPDLSAANIAANTPKIPEGSGPDGTWYFGNTHTAIIDSRQIYWDASATSPANGKQGTYLAVYNGQRFQLGQFPNGEPPYYPTG